MASIFLPSGEDVENICGKEELVTFHDVSCLYSPDSHVTVKYCIGSRVQTSDSDWIGVFPRQWEDVSNPVAKIQLPLSQGNGHRKAKQRSITFSASVVKSFQDVDKSYQFVYVDANQQVLGVSLPFKVTKPLLGNSGDDAVLVDSGSESPVMLTSGSEDEGDWDLGNAQSTPPQHSVKHEPTINAALGDIADPSPPVHLSGHFSGSDLSDIVVLSNSPSQEAAQNLPDISWTSDIDADAEDDAEEEINRSVEKIVIFGDKKQLRAAIEDTIPVCGAGNREEKVSHQVMHHSMFHQRAPLASSVEVPSTWSMPTRVNGTLLTGWPRPSVLGSLKIVELDNSSDEENENINKVKTKKNKEKNEDNKPIGVPEKVLEEKKNSSVKLITDITDAVKKNPASKSAAKHKKKSANKQVANAGPVLLEPTVKVEEPKVVEIIRAKQEPVSSTKVDVGITLLESPPNPALSSKSKKSKKKKRKERKRCNVAVDESDEDELSEVNQPKYSKNDNDKKKTQSSSAVKDDAVVSTIFSGRPAISKEDDESYPKLSVQNGLIFDELSGLSPKERKERLKEVRRMERKSSRAKGNQEQLDLEDVPPKIEEIDLKQRKKKKGKNNKQKVVVLEEKAEEIQSNGHNNAVIQDDTDLLAPDTDVVSLGEIELTVEENQAPREPRECSLPGEEMRYLRRKYSLGRKAKSTKKAKRSCSSRRRARPDCEIQYLYTSELTKKCVLGKTSTKESEADVGATLSSETVCFTSPPSISIQDTSDNGFPALPSQPLSVRVTPNNQKHNFANIFADMLSGSKISFNKTENKDKDVAHDNDDKVGDEDEPSLEEDAMDKALNSMCRANSPRRRSKSGARSMPFVVPEDVLDLMDALPPASASPDGRAMMEWGRSLQPLLPKHALPVFHNKYKAKFARKFEQRRMKLRRGALSRHSGIMDRWRRRADVDEQLLRSRRMSARAAKTAASEDKPEEKSGPAPPSYASIVKKSQDAIELTTHIAEDDESPKSVSLGENPVEPSLSLFGPWHTSEPLNFDAVPKAKGKGKKECAKTAVNFPKEFTNYTSSGESKILALTTAHAQNMFENSRPDPEGAESTAITSEPGIEWPIPKFIHKTSTKNALLENEPSFFSEIREEEIVPRVHIRASVSSQSKFKGSFKVKVSPKGKRDVPEGVEVNKENDTGDNESSGVLVDMALSSCLVDNAQLRTAMVSLENRLEELKLENKQKEEKIEEIQLELEDVKEANSTSMEKALVPISPRKELKKAPEDRKIAVCKWAGKVSKLVRTNTEVISLTSRLRSSEHELASLQNQVNTLKEALQAETKRSSRALTKWFKLKLKVKVLRAKLRDVTPVENGSFIDGSGVKGRGQVSTSVEVWEEAGVNEELREEQVEREECEPPCKRRRVRSPVEVDVYTKPSPKPGPMDAGTTSHQATEPTVAEAVTPTTDTCIPPPPPYPTAHQTIPPPGLLNQPSPTSFFHLFPNFALGLQQPLSAQQHAEYTQQQQHNMILHLQQLQQQQQHETNVPTQEGQQTVRSRMIPFAARKRSPPHLPLPTPSPPQFAPPQFAPPQFAPPPLPRQPSPPRRHASPPRHRNIHNAHPAADFPFASPYQPLAWPLPSMSPLLPQGPPSPLPNWPAMNLSPLICRAGTDRAPGHQAHFPPHPQNGWVPKPDQAWLEQLSGMYSPQQQWEGDLRGATLQPPPASFVNQAPPQAPPVFGNSFQQRQAYGYQTPPNNAPHARPTPPNVQIASPPGRYRSDFLRRLAVESTQSRRQPPNPYRLFHQLDAPARQGRLGLGVSPPYPTLPQGLLGVSPQTGLVSPQPPSNPEASYRNTAGFVELTSEGLQEVPHRDAPFSLGQLQNQQVYGNLSNSASINIGLDQYPSRLIESSTACRDAVI